MTNNRRHGALPAWPAGQRFWAQRNPRERRILQILALVLLGSLCLQSAWVLHHERKKLRQQLPRLAQTAEQVRALAERASLLRARDAKPDRLAEVGVKELAVQARALGTQVSAQAGPRGELLFRGRVDAAQWLDWVAKLHGERRWSLYRCQVNAVAGQSGQIEVEAEFRSLQERP